ncbi:MFS general substrate transporter [Laetiporus sulphureus 93-53]|uniref:MFS general substrate transporter n=1 Tax=Laetiporus sulphureus 93-53 TaxID=1314785 RepID=A0A165B6U6_9APHY|nr:MFS general substrate transporter [Laetiporus sulphureus 93-53]KZT00376.1 MFS general substrate transporter [Laetiporus sulphureus 93-53]
MSTMQAAPTPDGSLSPGTAAQHVASTRFAEPLSLPIRGLTSSSMSLVKTQSTEGEAEKAAIDSLAIVEVDNEVLDSPPDGGLHAWMTVAAVWLVTFTTFGIVNVWGILQSAYISDPSSHLRDRTVAQIGYIGGCSGGFTFAVGPLANILVSRVGVQFTVLCGVVLVSLSLMLASISMQYWQLLLSEGILFGIGCSFAFIPAVGLPSQWFAKRRSLATGIASSGSGIAGVVLPPISQALISHTSIAWCLRFLGFISLAFGLCGVLLIKQRSVAKRNVQYKAFDWRVLRISGFPYFLLFVFFQFFGYATPLFFIPSYCTAVGISASKASGVVSVANGMQVVGRVLSGTLADKAGPINLLIVFSLLMGLSSIVMWYFAASLGVLMVFAVFYGIFAGAYWSLSVPTAVKIVGIEKLGTAVSFQFLAVIIPSIFSVPLGSQIIMNTVRDGKMDLESRSAYRYLIVWSALVSVVASLVLLPVRFQFNRRLFEKV